MPFLMRKTGIAETNALMQGAREGNGTVWGEDEYSPSKNAAGLDGLGLPASPKLQRRLCGNAECMGGWTMPWRNRRRPIFDAQWGCSGRCVLALVRAAVRRELGDGGGLSPTPHRHRVPLGLLMLAQGWITHPQLQKALAAQRESGTGRIGEFVMPKVFVERFGLLPLRVAGSRILYLGFADQLNASAAFVTEQMTELKVESGVVDGASFEAARSRLLACDGVEMKLEAAADEDAMAGRITAILEQKQPIASRLIRLHQFYWLRMWLEGGALGKAAGNRPATSDDVKDYVFTVGAHE